MPGTEWYYAKKDKKLGPISSQDLEDMALCGELQPETLVWTEGMSGWSRHDAVFPEVWKALDRAGTLGGPSGVPATAGIPPVHPGLQCARCRRPLPVDDLVPIAGQRICLQCKSVVLQGLQENPAGETSGIDSELVAIRREHISQEASLKAIGIVCIFVAVLSSLLVLSMVSELEDPVVRRTLNPAFSLQLLALTAYVPLYLVIGFGLYRLSPRARIPAVFTFALGCIIPPTCFLNWLFLYTLLSKKGRRVLSDDYRTIIQQTPGVHFRQSRVRTIIVVLVIVGLVSFLGFIMLQGRK